MPTTITKLELRIAAIMALLAGAAAIGPAGAQGGGEAVNVDVSECVKLTTAEERLACFEKQVESSRANPSSAGAPADPRTAPPPSAAPPQAAAPPTAAPPPSAAPAPSAATPPNTAPPPSSGGGREIPADVEARVAELRETVPHAYLITLDNGQVWRQTVPKAYALRPGDPVRVYFSKWRTYRLTNERLRSFIQVERVR
jgi:hypothetical protein